MTENKKTPVRGRPGRPPLKPGERRSIILQFRVNPSELAKVESAAGDRPISDWLRERALGG